MKKVGGRPEKENKKNNKFDIRLTDNEKNILLNKLMNSDYKNMSSMILDIVLNGQYKVITTDEKQFNINNQILGEVNRIGNNFNQFVKSLNQRKTDNFTSEEIKKILFLLKEIKFSFDNITNKDI